MLCCAGQYDIDGNGLLDIVLVSTSGEIIFYRHDGLLFNQLSYQVSVLVLVHSGSALQGLVLLNLLGKGEGSKGGGGGGVEEEGGHIHYDS